MADTPPSDDPEYVLSFGNLRLRVAELGAALRGLSQVSDAGEETPIVTGYSGVKQKAGGQGDVLIPFPGRVRGGRYTWNGETYQMALNDKESPSAIHGFLRSVPWGVVEQHPQSITFAVNLEANQAPGYPFGLAVRVTYSLADDGLTCRFSITNTGAQTAPVAAGFHPYFSVGTEHINENRLHVPFRSRLAFDEQLLPTGEVVSVAGTHEDFLAPRPIGFTRFNTCYLDPVRDADGRVRVHLAAPEPGRALTVWMDEAFSYVVLYSGDPLPETHRRRALAIEPMTCASDAFNHPDWGLVSLAPSQTLTGAWGVVSS